MCFSCCFNSRNAHLSLFCILLTSILISLNRRGLYMFYSYGDQCVHLWKENKNKMMCLGITWLDGTYWACVCVSMFVLFSVRSFFLSVGAPCCGHFPSHHYGGFCRQREETFFCCGIAVIGNWFQLHLNTLTLTFFGSSETLYNLIFQNLE